MAELLASQIFYALASAGIDIAAGTATAITIGSYVVVAGTAYAVAQSMVKAPAFGSLQSETSGKVSMTRDTVASRRVIYGTVRASGPILFASTNGSKNEFLHMVVGIAGHEISQLHTIFFNDQIAFQNNTQSIALYPTDRLAMTYKVGAPTGQTAYVMEPSTEWTATDTLDGIASIYVRMTADPKVFPNGIPNISAVVTGRKIKDIDGNDINSGSYSNPALILNDYLRNYFGASAAEIETGSFKNSQVICDQTPFSGSGDYTKRYTCNYSFTQNVKPSKIIEDILKTCYGKLTYVNGQFVLNVGYYRTPVVSINEDDIISGITVTTKPSQASSYNRVNGLYVDGSTYTSSFQAGDFVPVTSSFYLAEDNGIESAVDIELSGVTNHTTARRIAKLNLLDSRQDLSVQFTTKISGLQLIAGDNVYVTVERYGWAGKVFEVVELTINQDLSINLTLKETAAEIYDFPVGEDVDRDLSPNTNLPSPFFVSPPLGFSAIESTTIDADGTVFPAATLNWSSSLTGSVSDIEVDFKITSSANYDTLGKFGRDTRTFTTIDVEAGKTYSFRARNFNYLGVMSEYVSQSLYIQGDNTRPQAPYSGSAIGGSGSLYVTWLNSAVDRDYKFTQVFTNTSNASASAQNEGTVSGTSWNKTITTSGSYYVWLKNIDTSGNQSDISSGGNAFVSAIGQGAPGPAGPSGSAGFAYTNIYRRSDLIPSGPTYPVGNIPVSGWDLLIPADTGEALWQSSGLISNADNTTLTGSWSAPKRLNGRLSYYQTTSPSSGMVEGDIWFDIDDKMKVYRFSSGSWVSVQDENIPTLSSSLQQNITNTTSYSASLASSIVANSASFSTNLNQTNNTITNNSSSAAASITSVGAAVTTNSSSFAATITTLDTKVVNNSSSLASSITTVNGSVTTNSQSFALSINTLTSTVTNNSSSFASSLTTTNNTVANNSSSAATSITTLSSTVTNNSASSAASITTTATTLASVSGSVVNLGAEYGVSVTAGRVTGFKILSTPTVSDFTIQADKFAIVNSTGGSSKAPFIVEGGITYIDGAVIKSLDAGKITAGIITAAIRMTAGEITGSGYQVTSPIGMRALNNTSVLTVTGGSDNATGGQIDLVGNSAGAGIAGVAQIIAGNVSTGHILLKTGGDNTRLKVDYNGTVGINTTSPDSGYKLDVNGGVKVGGNIATSGDIRKITNDDWTVPMNDGSNSISQQWDGSDYKVRVDATDFIIAREGNDVTFNSVNTTSSERYKKNITNLTGSLDIIDKLQPKIYDRKDGSRVDEMGLIAEAVYEVLPNVVCKNKDGSIEGLDYSKLIPVLLGAIKELKSRVETLENK